MFGMVSMQEQTQKHWLSALQLKEWDSLVISRQSICSPQLEVSSGSRLSKSEEAQVSQQGSSWHMLLSTMMRRAYAFLLTFSSLGRTNKHMILKGPDSGNLVILTGQDGERPQPIGIIWGGTANRGRLKLKSGQGPENWTSGVDLGRLLDLLELDLMTTSEGLQEALEEHRITLAAAAAVNSTATESSPVATAQETEKVDKIYEPLGVNIQQLPRDGSANLMDQPNEFHVDTVEGMNNVEDRQFIPNLIGMSPLRGEQEGNGELNNLAELENSPEGICFSLHLGEREPMRLHSDSATLDIDLQK